MNNFGKKILDRVSFDWTRIALGFLICLVSVFGALSNAPVNDGLIYVSKFINWCVSFLVGSIMAYAVYFICFLYGLKLIFWNKKLAKRNLNMTIFGIVLIVISCLILVTNGAVNPDLGYLTFANFGSYFEISYVDFPNVANFTNTGIIGMSLVALINSGMTNIGSNVIGSILLVLGVGIVLGKPVVKASKIIIDYKNQVFRKDVKENNPGFDVAKDVEYTYNNVNNIQEVNQNLNSVTQPQNFINQTFEEKKVNEIQEERAPNEETFIKEAIKEDNETVFKANPIQSNVNQTNGLVKAHFDLDNEKPANEQVEVKSSEVSQFKNEQTYVEEVHEEPIYKESINYGNKVTEETLNASVNYSEENYENNSNDGFEGNNFAENNNINETFEEQVKLNTQTSIADRARTYEINHIAQEVRSTPANTPINNTPREPEPVARPIQQETRVQRAEPVIQEENNYSNKVEIKKKKQYSGPYVYPSADLLEVRDSSKFLGSNTLENERRKAIMNQVFADFGIGAQITSYTIGPSVTRFDLQMDKNVSVNAVNKYIDDLSIRLGGLDCRFVPIVQGKSTSGIEIANLEKSVVNFKDCLEHLPTGPDKGLFIPFGQDISGNYIHADLKEFPHLLVCGTTGSGKSIFMHSVIMSLIMRNPVDELKFIMIDPKKVEFGKYKEMPHLLCPPISDAHQAYIALKKLCDEMDRRYGLFEDLGVSNIKQYNEEALENGREKLPYIVLICDEFADLMDLNRKCSEPVVRIGQKARASGIHMIIATQRPSTNVITGTIKANLPVRVALSCSSYTDSITVLGEGGAEKLLGYGDMLVSCSLISKQGFVRIQGCLVDNKEIRRTVEFLKSKYEPEYDPNFLNLIERSASQVSLDNNLEEKEEATAMIYAEVKKWVMAQEYTSISKIQHNFKVGFPRATKFFERLIAEGIVEDSKESNNSSKGRKVLVRMQEDDLSYNQNPGSIEQTTMDYSSKGY